MNAIPEALGIIFNSVITFAFSILKAVFGIKDSIDSFQDLMLATVLGVPVWVITLVNGVIAVGVLIFWIVKKLKRI